MNFLLLIAVSLTMFTSTSVFAFNESEITNEISASQPPQGYPIVKGVVRRVSLSQGTIMIKHETIPNLNMPPMTMTFKASGPNMVQGLNSGDKIRFVATEEDGNLVVLWLEKLAKELE